MGELVKKQRERDRQGGKVEARWEGRVGEER